MQSLWASRRCILVMGALLPLVASCGTGIPGAPAGKRFVDYTAFKQFRFWRTGAGVQSLCLPGESIYTAAVTQTVDGRYRLQISIVRETPTAFGDTVACNQAGTCYIEVHMPPRDLTADELATLRGIFGAVAVADGGACLG